MFAFRGEQELGIHSRMTPNTLLPKCSRPIFCLILKFGQAILIRVLMPNL